jgi:iron complex outermembrane receptor protein
VLSARIWYETTGRNLPSSLLVSQPNLKETQLDESFRSLLNYTSPAGKGKLSITGAWFMNRLDYSNSLVSIDSRNNANTLTLKAAYEQNIAGIIKLSARVTNDLNLVTTNNYEGRKNRNTASLSLSAETITETRLQETLLVREIIDKGKPLVPDFSAGMAFRLTDSKQLFLKANISRNSRIPSMNDLFWLPGGNAGLRNEYAWTGELSLDLNQVSFGHFLLQTDLGVFRNDIRNMIQWHPGEYSYWTAGNIKSVRTAGTESSVNLGYSSGKFSAAVIGNYSYTRATTIASETLNDASVGKQLIYVPANQANCSFSAAWWKLYSSWQVSMTGKRYLTSDNSDSLPGYAVNNLTTGFRVDTRRSLIDLNFEIANIFGADYQTIAYFPMPGRNYSINLLIRILK